MTGRRRGSIRRRRAKGRRHGSAQVNGGGLGHDPGLAGAEPARAAFVSGTGGATFTPLFGASFFSGNANGAGGDIAAKTGSPSQSPSNINALVNSLFGVSASLVGTGTVSGLGAGGRSGTVSGGSFNVAAVHAGGNEYVLQFANLTNSFTFASLGAGFSNARLYSTAVVPLPGAALLFGSALAGLAWMRRRRAADAADGSGVAA
jgi:hypothetical protein